MKISAILSEKKPTLSFEVFPPKTSDSLESVTKAVDKIAALHPSFMSVTYGAGGGTSLYTADISRSIQDDWQVPSLAHLTCITSTKKTIHDQLDLLKRNRIENIMALRGDFPADFDTSVPRDYHYASELIHDIKTYDPSFCIGAACYPEGHVENEHKSDDIRFLKEKVDAGVDFLTTQMFFDNNILYNFLYRAREAGIRVPVLAGIMPITQKRQLERARLMSGTYVPTRFLAIVDRFGDNPKAMRQAGIAYATDQIIDLIANGVEHIHVYTMNKPLVAAAICQNLSEILS